VTHSFYPDSVTVDRGVLDQSPDLRLDRREDVRDLGRRSSQVVDRAYAKRHGRDSEINASTEQVVELLGAEIVGYPGMGEAVLAGVAPIAVEDDPDMARNLV
jgi:hypothetical protein